MKESRAAWAERLKRAGVDVGNERPEPPPPPPLVNQSHTRYYKASKKVNLYDNDNHMDRGVDSTPSPLLYREVSDIIRQAQPEREGVDTPPIEPTPLTINDICPICGDQISIHIADEKDITEGLYIEPYQRRYER